MCTLPRLGLPRPIPGATPRRVCKQASGNRAILVTWSGLTICKFGGGVRPNALGIVSLIFIKIYYPGQSCGGSRAYPGNI